MQSQQPGSAAKLDRQKRNGSRQNDYGTKKNTQIEKENREKRTNEAQCPAGLLDTLQNWRSNQSH
jgi:hypothetical protein